MPTLFSNLHLRCSVLIVAVFNDCPAHLLGTVAPQQSLYGGTGRQGRHGPHLGRRQCAAGIGETQHRGQHAAVQLAHRAWQVAQPIGQPGQKRVAAAGGIGHLNVKRWDEPRASRVCRRAGIGGGRARSPGRRSGPAGLRHATLACQCRPPPRPTAHIDAGPGRPDTGRGSGCPGRGTLPTS